MPRTTLEINGVSITMEYPDGTDQSVLAQALHGLAVSHGYSGTTAVVQTPTVIQPPTPQINPTVVVPEPDPEPEMHSGLISLDDLSPEEVQELEQLARSPLSSTPSDISLSKIAHMDTSEMPENVRLEMKRQAMTIEEETDDNITASDRRTAALHAIERQLIKQDRETALELERKSTIGSFELDPYVEYELDDNGNPIIKDYGKTHGSDFKVNENGTAIVMTAAGIQLSGDAAQAYLDKQKEEEQNKRESLQRLMKLSKERKNENDQ